MTAEFFQLLRQHLTVEGGVVSNLIAAVSGDQARLLMAEVRTMNTVFPNVYLFPVNGAEYHDPQNVEILATLDSTPLTETDFANLAKTTPIARAVPLADYVNNYHTLETSNAIVLTDNFAPVETLLNPLTGQPLASESTVNWREIESIAAVVLAISVVFIILVKKRVL